ncbi:TPA: MurR/RpiR family transcriptional regulator [Klebsiella pneumoniae]|nr:MurR/RpiR family transcriptional regulator [Klebsiella pneumoniae]HDQ3432487.1 MurR/RpiR family transcriptional regulator [Klebsiella pneumoniae]
MSSSPEQLGMLKKETLDKYDKLSKRLQCVARYILDDNNISFETIESLSERLHVSSSTIFRFTTVFGYSGFSDFKKVFKQQAMKEIDLNATESIISQDIRSVKKTPVYQQSRKLKLSVMENIVSLQNISSQLTDNKFDKASSLLLGAERVFIFGPRHSFSVSCYLIYALLHVEKPVFMIDDSGNGYEQQLKSINQKDVLFIISDCSYAQRDVELIENFTSTGVMKIAIVDSIDNPFLPFSDVCFVAQEAVVDGFRSQIVSMNLVQALTYSLVASHKNTSE